MRSKKKKSVEKVDGVGGEVRWSTSSVILGLLHPWPNNPNKMGDFEFGRLGESLKRFGYVEEIVINLDNMIIGGFHRYKQLLAAHGENFEIEVRVPSRLLSSKEVDELGLMLNTGGRIDKNVLLDRFKERELIDRGIYRREDIKVMDGGFDSLKGPKKKELPKDQSMKSLTIEMLPEDYELLVSVIEPVDIQYLAKSIKLRLGLKLGAYVRTQLGHV